MTKLHTDVASLFITDRKEPSTITVNSYYSKAEVHPTAIKTLEDDKHKGGGLEVLSVSVMPQPMNPRTS